MTDDHLQPIKTEIGFFMDKLFQSSFVYIGALFATLATTSLDATSALAKALGTSSRAIVILSVLSANLIFLVLACSCTFAVLKRGMFIIESSNCNTSSPLACWEIFVRRTNQSWNDLSWNVDNYYVAVLGFFVFAASLIAGVAGLTKLAGGERGVAGLLLALHAVPIWMLWQVARINAACRQLISKKRKDGESASLGPCPTTEEISKSKEG